MRYMGKGKKVTTSLMVPLFLLSYFCYLVFDHIHQPTTNYDIATAKMANLDNLAIDSLIIGGSNAYWSLNAEYLTEETFFKWFNLSLNNEAYSDENYWGYIESAMDENKRLNIKNIIYSSVRPLRFGSIVARSKITNVNAFGQRKFSILPNRPLASRLKSLFKPNLYRNNDLIPTTLGDLDFSTHTCRKFNVNQFRPELDLYNLELWLNRQLKSIKHLFPNAQIFMVLPSEIYSDDFSIEKFETVYRFIHLLVRKYSETTKTVQLIKQPNYPDISFTCDSGHHGNLKGRIWRTTDLIQQITPLLTPQIEH